MRALPFEFGTGLVEGASLGGQGDEGGIHVGSRALASVLSRASVQLRPLRLDLSAFGSECRTLVGDS